MNYNPDDTVKTCKKLESGLRLGPESIHACCMGAFMSPVYWSADEASGITITKEMIIDKRKWLFRLLNDKNSDITCKRCSWVEEKPFREINFHRLGHVDLAHYTFCNLRCNYCGFTRHNQFNAAKYDALKILQEFSAEDVEWDSYVDLNGGEPTLLKDLDEYIDYFASRRIRIMIYTNAVRFNQSIYDGLANGTIRWAVNSLDAGTVTSYHNLKGKDRYLQVLENLTRYAHAGNQGGGMLAVKYIFCDSNCSDDDIVGFTYAMLAIRPQKIWLTFDFFPFADKYDGQEEIGVYDFSRHIKAYAKMYCLLKRHGVEATHFSMAHPTIVQRGNYLLDSVFQEIEALNNANSPDDPRLILKDFRKEGAPFQKPAATFNYQPLTIKQPDHDPRPWSLEGSRVALAPACGLTAGLLTDPAIRGSNLIGFLDRNQLLHGKKIEGLEVKGYEAIPALSPDIILVASPEQHRNDILGTIAKYVDNSVQIVVLDRS